MPFEIGGIIFALLILFLSLYSNNLVSTGRELAELKSQLDNRVDSLFIKYNGDLNEILMSEKELLTPYEYNKLKEKTLLAFDEQVSR
jgi:hypothetical protein